MTIKIERWRKPHAPNPAMLRQILGGEGYRVFQWCDQPEAFYAMHKHPEAQSHWVISGTLEITVEAQGSYKLEAGDRDFLPAETYHTARIVGEEAVLYLVGEKIKLKQDSRKKTQKSKKKNSG